MKITTLAAAALIALAPAVAGAVTVSPNSNIVDGQSYNLSDGPFQYGLDFTAADGAGSVSFTFTNDVQGVSGAGSQGTVLQFTGTFFDGVTAAWTNGETETVASGATGMFHVSTVLAFGASDTLTVSWGDVTGNFADIDLAVAAVPLPAGVLLLGTALGGLGIARRRKKTV